MSQNPGSFDHKSSALPLRHACFLSEALPFRLSIDQCQLPCTDADFILNTPLRMTSALFFKNNNNNNNQKQKQKNYYFCLIFRVALKELSFSVPATTTKSFV